MSLHANAIPKDGSASEGTGRVDCEDPDSQAILPITEGYLVDEGALANPRRTRKANHMSFPCVWVKLFKEVSGGGNLVVNISKQTCGCPHVACNNPFSNAHSLKPFLHRRH
jgi:hypothetical protein